MICPRCRREGETVAGHCSWCGAAVSASNPSGEHLADEEMVSAGPTLGHFDAEGGDSEATRLAPATSPAPSAASAQGPFIPGQRFGNRYHIVRLLGIGGMGAVYQAWDEELEVVVALKVVRPEIAADPQSAKLLDRRFKQELLLARRVTHRNVVRIHDLGDVGGIKYITMPYIEGTDLATILKREETLPVRRALKIARAMVSGLAAAHAAEVVHRDLKPANLMIDADGEALIMDFGIARSTSTGRTALDGTPISGRPAAAGYTVAGAIMGTVEYMAPEQAKAQAVDHRVDIYAFGLILYDMLVGRQRADRAESALAELTSRTLGPPPPLRSINPEIPEAIDALVTRCLQPDPAARFQATADLEAELNRLDEDGNPLPLMRRVTPRLIAAVLALLVSVAAATYWLARGPAPVVEQPPTSVLVADFKNETGDPVFDGALEQALTIGIEGASFITAYPRATAQQVAQQKVRTGKTLDEASARLVALAEGIKLVLSGSIESAGSGYTIAVSAVDPANGQSLVAASTSASSKTDVLARVAALATQLRARLGDTATEGEALAAKETITAGSLEAMQAYARGLELNDAARFGEALKFFELALSKDPEFGRAYAGMGTAYYSLGQRRDAEVYYQKALKLLDRMSEREKYRTLGLHYLTVSRNYEEAVKTFETLVQHYPADRAGHANLAVAYSQLRDFPKAMREGQAALEINPKNLVQRTNYAMYAMYAGDFKTAMEQSEIVLKDNPSFEYPILTLARSAAAAGDLQAARTAYARLSSVSPLGSSIAVLGELDLAMYEGRYREASRVVESIVRKSVVSDDSVAGPLLLLAEVNQALGRGASAADAAVRAAKAGNNESVLFPAARVLLDVGRTEQALALAHRLENMLQNQTASYARLIEGEVALKAGRLLTAIDALRDGQKRHDSWYAHYLLGRAYLEARHFAEALAEFDRCLKRRGEATDVFIVDASTLRYLPPLYYWLARAQEGLGNAGARENYQRYLDLRRNADSPDPLAADARRRLGTRQIDAPEP